MTTNPTPTTHAAKAEAARQAARSSGLGSPAAMYFLGIAQTHAILEVAEQLRIHNLIALAQVQLPPENVDADDLVYVRNQAASALIHLEDQECRRADGDLDVVELLALRPDVAAALGIEPLDEQEQQ